MGCFLGPFSARKSPLSARTGDTKSATNNFSLCNCHHIFKIHPLGIACAARLSGDRVMDGLFSHRTDWEKPLVQGCIQASNGEVGSTIKRLQHDTSNSLSGGISAKNYERMFANFATLCLHDRNGVVIDFWRDRKHNLAARIGRSGHGEILIEQLQYKKLMDCRILH